MMRKAKAPRSFDVKDMQASHSLAVVWIEKYNDEPPQWHEAMIRKALADMNFIKVVATVGKDVVGYGMGWLNDTELDVQRLVVNPDFRRRGIGAAILGLLTLNATTYKRKTTTIVLHENNLGGQLFLKALNFRAVKVIKGFWGDPLNGELEQDAYFFRKEQT